MGHNGRSMRGSLFCGKSRNNRPDKSTGKRGGPWNIRVNCIAPGVIDTDMMAGFSRQDIAELTSQTPLGRIGAPQDIAALALFLASADAQFITGQVISPNGGLVI